MLATPPLRGLGPPARGPPPPLYGPGPSAEGPGREGGAGPPWATVAAVSPGRSAVGLGGKGEGGGECNPRFFQI